MTASAPQTADPSRPSIPDAAMPEGSTGDVRRRRRGRPHPARTAAAVLFAAVPTVLGLAASGGGHSGPGVASGAPTTTAQAVLAVSASSASLGSNSSGSPAGQALAFARCMRRHGVADFPDPNSSGNFPPSAKEVSLKNPQQFQEARTACSNLLPNGGNGPTAAQWQQILATMLDFAHCMQHHGVPNWPDPTSDSRGRPVFNMNVDPNSPQFAREIQACKHLLVNYGNRPGWPDLSNYFQ